MLTKITGLIISYLIGSIPTAYIFGKIAKNIDIRKVGSGNVGATNAFRVLGKPIGITVLFLDVLKALVAVVLIPYFLKQDNLYYNFAIFFAVFCGHNWTIFLNFKGGKGMAVSLGGLVGLAIVINDLRMPLTSAILVWILVFSFTKYVSLSSIISALSLPLLLVLFHANRELVIIASVLSAIILYKHKSNIYRLLQGKEPRLKITSK
jgi:glycerol-3-phosphate acyltransferase PlsY